MGQIVMEEGTAIEAIHMTGTSTACTTSTTNTVYIVFVFHWQAKVDHVRNGWYI